MSGRWWRAYSRARHDPKLLKLSDRDFRWWFNFVCVAADNDGRMPYVRDLAAEFRTSEHTIAVAIERLRCAGLFEIDGEPGPDVQYVPHNWNGLQYKNDVSTDRVKRFRKRRETVSETPSESEADTEADTEQKVEKGKSGAVAPSPLVADAVARFNSAAAEHDWPIVQSMNATRKKALTGCLKAVGGIDGWQAMLAKVTASDFLMGRTARSDDHAHWRFTFDFLLMPKRYIKIMEGGYDNRNGTHQPERGISAVLAALAD